MSDAIRAFVDELTADAGVRGVALFSSHEAHGAFVVAVLSRGAALTACSGQAAQTATSGASSGAAASESAAAQEGQSLYGLSESPPKAKATADGVEFQVTKRDGRSLPATADLRPRRIDAVIDIGVLVSASAG